MGGSNVSKRHMRRSLLQQYMKILRVGGGGIFFFQMVSVSMYHTLFLGFFSSITYMSAE